MSNRREKKYSLMRWISFLKDLGKSQKEIAEVNQVSTRTVRSNTVSDSDFPTPLLHGFSLDCGEVHYLKGLYEKVTDMKYARTHEGKMSDSHGVKKTKLYKDIKRVEINYDEIDYYFFYSDLIERIFENKTNGVKSKLKALLYYYRKHIPLETSSIFIANNILDKRYRRFVELYYDKRANEFKSKLRKYVNFELEAKSLDYFDIDRLKLAINGEFSIDKYLIQFKGMHKSNAMDYEMLSPLYDDLLKLSKDKTITISEIAYILTNLKVKYGVNDSIRKKCCRYEGLNLVNDNDESLCLEKGYCVNSESVRKMIDRGGFSRIPFILMPI